MLPFDTSLVEFHYTCYKKIYQKLNIPTEISSTVHVRLSLDFQIYK